MVQPPMENSVILVLVLENASSSRSIVVVNGVVMAYVTTAKHAIAVQEIVGDAGVPPSPLQEPPVRTMDIQPVVNAPMVSTTPYKRPPSLLTVIPPPDPGPTRDFVPSVLSENRVCLRDPVPSLR